MSRQIDLINLQEWAKNGSKVASGSVRELGAGRRRCLQRPRELRRQCRQAKHRQPTRNCRLWLAVGQEH
jgi:hypothetical protein